MKGEVFCKKVTFSIPFFIKNGGEGRKNGDLEKIFIKKTKKSKKIPSELFHFSRLYVIIV